MRARRDRRAPGGVHAGGRRVGVVSGYVFTLARASARLTQEQLAERLHVDAAPSSALLGENSLRRPKRGHQTPPKAPHGPSSPAGGEASRRRRSSLRRVTRTPALIL